MPHKDYDAVAASIQRRQEPLTFTFCGTLFTTAPTPTLGDTFDLLDAPEIEIGDLSNESRNCRVLASFIRSMLVDEAEKEKWDKVLYTARLELLPVLMLITNDLVEQYSARPTSPPVESPSTSPGPGPKRSQRRGGKAGKGQ